MPFCYRKIHFLWRTYQEYKEEITLATITYRTTDDKKQKLAALAKDQDISINKVIDELVTVAVTEREAFNRYKIRAARGNSVKALNILQSKAED